MEAWPKIQFSSNQQMWFGAFLLALAVITAFADKYYEIGSGSFATLICGYLAGAHLADGRRRRRMASLFRRLSISESRLRRAVRRRRQPPHRAGLLTQQAASLSRGGGEL